MNSTLFERTMSNGWDLVHSAPMIVRHARCERRSSTIDKHRHHLAADWFAHHAWEDDGGSVHVATTRG